MSREVKTIKLSKCEVDIITYLTWGEKEEIQSSIMGGMEVGNGGVKGIDPKIFIEAKYKALELCVKEIRTDGVKAQFTREWMNNLSSDDGDKLYDAVDDLSKKK